MGNGSFISYYIYYFSCFWIILNDVLQPDINLAFDSVNYTIMQEVAFGWLFRHIHGVAASVVFLIIYIHMLTGIYYGSYKQGRDDLDF